MYSLLSLLSLHQCSGNSFQWQMFSPSSGFPNCSHPQLSASHFYLNLTICPAYNISAWTAQKKTIPLLLLPVVAMQACLFAKPLLSNGCCIAASFVVIA
jgi:hypothetical protein